MCPPSKVRGPGVGRVIVVGLVTLVGVGPAAAAQATPATSAAGPWSLSPASSPPATVADIIEMTTFGSDYNSYWQRDIAVFSPDGSRVATVIKRGNLARNTVDYALLVFRTNDLYKSPKADTVATLSSSTNGPGIGHVRWLADNATLAFVGQRPGAISQGYTVDIRTHALTQRTHAQTPVTDFAIVPAGGPVVYSAWAVGTLDSGRLVAMRARGFAVPAEVDDGDEVADLLADDRVSMARAFGVAPPPFLSVERRGTVTTLPMPAEVPKMSWGEGGAECTDGSLTVAPNGERALVTCGLRVKPESAGYSPQLRQRWWWDGQIFVLDLKGGQARPLSRALVGIYSSAVWAPDSRSVVVANALLPLDVPDSAARTARATHRMVAEVDIETGQMTEVTQGDSLWVLGWNAQSGLVELTHGWAGPDVAAPHVFYRKTASGWTAVSARHVTRPTLVIDQGMNTPRRLVVVDPVTQARHVVYDPNPGLLAARRFGRETVFHWTTKVGNKWVAGLYYPPDYMPGRRYPLVIQTHGFDSTAFVPDGIFTTGEAAQPLANAGMVVLQVTDGPTPFILHDAEGTSREAPLIQDGVEGAIDALDQLALIDRTKIGMQGFSRTCYHTLYFLTHSSYPIAAATVTDGVDFSYLQYLVFPNIRHEWESANGGKPWGAGITTWREQAPGFNLDRITTPLQLTALGYSGALLTEWEPYAGLLLQGKPAEMVYIPDGEHILVKPWERLTSQQGSVDWYRFWLQRYEDPDPAKAEQYSRWHRLRAMRDSSRAQSVSGTK